MTRLYARALGGRRIHEATPGGHWKILTILGAMSLRGMIATMTIEEATDTDIFLVYVEQVLCPALQSGDVVVMDNLSSHKVNGVRELIQQAGAEVLYLPPYSPDLNPIEKAWAKLKQLLDLRPSLLNRVEVGGIGRPVNQAGSRGGDELLHPGHFVRGQIVHDDYLSGMELRAQHLLQIGQEDIAIGR